MKRQAIGTLIKDVIIAVVAYAFIAFLLNATKIDIFYGSPMNQMFAGIFIAGIPFGWRWASKIFTAISLGGILIKLVFSIVLGWLAIFVIIIGDIIRVFAAPKASKAVEE